MVKYGAIYCSQSVWLCFQPDRRRVCLIRCLLHAARPDKFVSESALIMNCQRIICTVERSQKKLLTVSVNKPETEQASLQNLQLNGRWNMFVHIQTAGDHVCLGSRIKRLMYLFPLWLTNLPRCGQLWWFSTDAPTRCGCCKKKKREKKDLAARAGGGSCSGGCRTRTDSRLRSTAASQRWTCFLRRGNERKTQTKGRTGKKGKRRFCQLSATKRSWSLAEERQRKGKLGSWFLTQSLYLKMLALTGTGWVQLRAISRRFAGRFLREILDQCFIPLLLHFSLVFVLSLCLFYKALYAFLNYTTFLLSSTPGGQDQGAVNTWHLVPVTWWPMWLFWCSRWGSDADFPTDFVSHSNMHRPQQAEVLVTWSSNLMQKIRCTAAHLAAISLLETKQLERDAALDMSFCCYCFCWMNEKYVLQTALPLWESGKRNNACGVHINAVK